MEAIHDPNNRSLAAYSPAYLALGLLMSGPAHGYRLHQAYAAYFGEIWQVGRSKFYAVLNDLEAAGLIASTLEPQANHPPRKIYALSDPGRQAFEGWLYSPVTPMRRVRVELLARLRFFTLIDLPGVEVLLDAQIDACRAELERFRLRAAQHDQQDDLLYELLFEFRRSQVEAVIDWLHYCKLRIHHQEGIMRLSARNQLEGTIVRVKEGAVTAEVIVRLKGGEEIVSVITVESARGLGLAPGKPVRAVIKSTEVLIAAEE